MRRNYESATRRRIPRLRVRVRVTVRVTVMVRFCVWVRVTVTVMVRHDTCYDKGTHLFLVSDATSSIGKLCASPTYRLFLSKTKKVQTDSPLTPSWPRYAN